MTVCLPTERVFWIKERCSRLVCSATMSIQELAEVIGPLVSSFPGVLYGPLFYRQSEHDKTMALRQNKGNYQACIKLSQESVAELQWWCNNIETAEYPICTPKAKIDITPYTDASSKGWGAVIGGEKTGGGWAETESKNHIVSNSWLYSLVWKPSVLIWHLYTYAFNRTIPLLLTISTLWEAHSMGCDSVAKEIWLFCIQREIWISAAHIPGNNNIQVDSESTVFTDNKEWMLRKEIFQNVTESWGEPTIDLFASRLNVPVACYASWSNLCWCFFNQLGKPIFPCFSPIWFWLLVACRR